MDRMDKWAQMGAKPGCMLWETWDEICQKPKDSWYAEAAGQLSFRTLLISLPTQPVQSRGRKEDRRILIKFLTECVVGA